ncbi:MAG: NCS1 family nucleobase:cation symporter-1 [Bradymonadaceae bacterium]
MVDVATDEQGLVQSDDIPEDPVLHNPDLEPTAAEDRTWDKWNLAALWVGMSVCIPTFLLAGSLIKMGMNWWQATLTVLLGNLIVLVPLVLNGHAGTKYGIPFPVFARASFGVFGAHVPSIARALVASGWFGIQCFVGGEAILQMIKAVWPGFATIGANLGVFAGLPGFWMKEGVLQFLWLDPASWICFMLFWFMNMFFVWEGHESIKWLENLAAPLLLLAGLGTLGWAAWQVGGVGILLGKSVEVAAAKTDVSGLAWLGSIFLPGLTAVVGFWATLSLNIPDFTRFCRTQRDQMEGQAFGLPTTMVFFSFVAIMIASASLILFDETIVNPADLVDKIPAGSGYALLIFFLSFIIVIATLSTNIAANVVAPANSYSNAFPKRISFRMGGVITGVLGIVILPWKVMDVLTGFLVSYSGVLGPIGGILVADYWLLRGTDLEVAELYRSDGKFRYDGGFNWRAIGALALGMAVVLAGKLHASIGFLFQGAWFTGFGTAFVAYWFLMKDRIEERVG